MEIDEIVRKKSRCSFAFHCLRLFLRLHRWFLAMHLNKTKNHVAHKEFIVMSWVRRFNVFWSCLKLSFPSLREEMFGFLSFSRILANINEFMISKQHYNMVIVCLS